MQRTEGMGEREFMEVTVFSFLTALICFNLFFLFFSAIKRTRFLLSNGPFLVMALIALCLVRVVFAFEFPFAMVLSSKRVLPALVTFGRTSLFEAFGWHVTINIIAITIWITVSTVLLFRLAYILVKHNKSLNSIVSIPSSDADRIMSEIVSRTKPRQKYRLICSETIATPMVSGFFKPTICFPAMSLSDSELSCVLSHEWNHFLYKDIWVKLLFYIAWSIIWWNPLFYVLNRDLGQMLEIRCDIRSTYDCSKIERIKYLESVLSVAKQLESSGKRMPVNSVAFIGSNRTEGVKQRFEIVLGYERRPSRIKNTIVCCLVVLTLLTSYCFVVQSAFEPPGDEAIILNSDITSDNSYITIHPNGTYEIYIEGVYMGIIDADNLLSEPFSLLPQIELID